MILPIEVLRYMHLKFPISQKYNIINCSCVPREAVLNILHDTMNTLSVFQEYCFWKDTVNAASSGQSRQLFTSLNMTGSPNFTQHRWVVCDVSPEIHCPTDRWEYPEETSLLWSHLWQKSLKTIIAVVFLYVCLFFWVTSLFHHASDLFL